MEFIEFLTSTIVDIATFTRDGLAIWVTEGLNLTPDGQEFVNELASMLLQLAKLIL